MRKWSYWALLVGVLALAFAVLGMAAQKPAWELINWDKPVPAAQRVAADKYILPEGWQEATKGVHSITFFNAGAMKYDPATLANIHIFEKLTGIKVNYIEVPDAIQFAKILSVLAAHDPSVQIMSVSQAPMMQLSQLIAAGWLQAIPFWTPEVQAIYSPGIVKSWKWRDGKFYCAADTVRTHFLFYRPSWLKAAGVKKVPETWQEVLEAAKKCREWAVKHLGPDYWGYVFPGDGNLVQHFQSMIYSQGARVLHNGKPVWNSPEGRNAWQLYYDFIASGAAPKACLGYTWSDYQDVFAHGKAAMELGFSTYVRRYGEPNLSPALQTDVFGNPVKGGDFAVVAPPKWDASMPDKYRAASLDLDVVVINKFADPRKIAAAMLFAEYRQSKQACTNEVLIEGNESFFPGVYDNPEVMSKVAYPEVRKASIRNAVFEVFPPGSAQCVDTLIEYFDDAVAGKFKPQEALDRAQAEINRIFGP